jgi:hypothetical protein
MMMSEADRQGFDVSFDASGTLQVIEANEASKAVAIEGGCSAGIDTLQAAVRPASQKSWINTPKITRRDRMRNRKACALPLGRCGLAYA